MSKPIFKYRGIDFWGRPQFQSEQGLIIGSVDTLFNFGATGEQVYEKLKDEQLVIFGYETDGDPLGDIIDMTKVVIQWN